MIVEPQRVRTTKSKDKDSQGPHRGPKSRFHVALQHGAQHDFPFYYQKYPGATVAVDRLAQVENATIICAALWVTQRSLSLV